jgi:hypothetical protein
MCVYIELLERASRAYRDASNGFYSSTAYKKIYEAIAGFEPPFKRLCVLIAAERSDRFVDREEYTIAARNELRVIEAQNSVLRAALSSASRESARKASRGPTGANNAKIQEIADVELRAHVDKIIREAREDAERAHTLPPPERRHHHPSQHMSAEDLAALADHLTHAGSPKEDALFAQQLAQIGGQSEQG